MHYGLDPIMMLTTDDPILAELYSGIVETAQGEREKERADLANRIVNGIAELLQKILK